jgi:hypothetical protein
MVTFMKDIKRITFTQNDQLGNKRLFCFILLKIDIDSIITIEFIL